MRKTNIKMFLAFEIFHNKSKQFSGCKERNCYNILIVDPPNKFALKLQYLILTPL